MTKAVTPERMRLFEESHVYESAMKPNARQEAIVEGACYRFTVLTSQLIRMEYAADGVFENRATQVVLNRDFDVPEFRVLEDDTELTNHHRACSPLLYERALCTKHALRRRKRELQYVLQSLHV